MLKPGLSFKGKLPVIIAETRKSKSFTSGHRKQPQNVDPTIAAKKTIFVYRSGLPPPREKRRVLLLIDPQNDFIADGAPLKVPGAIEDAKRVAEAISMNAKRIDQIVVTLDTHQRMHIAHPTFWKAPDGSHPKPFTEITLTDVRKGDWLPVVEAFYGWSLTYLMELEKENRFKLTIWPEHCLVGTKGHAVVDSIAAALHDWEHQRASAVDYLLKGNNALTEHYSCFKAEVPRPDDPLTNLNAKLVTMLDSFDEIIVAGQALSHCVNYSMRDLVSNLSPDSRQKIILLRNGCSSIPGYEKVAEEFLSDMAKAGVQFMLTSEMFPPY